ncbi:hypothetical protein WT83_10765 [Burkholderia territorii]|uniref:Lactonase family protein n=1 Tax=Burkholderia territorii TaxID=1503055 RepID=A0A108EXC8_9BURK|nr:hypothetical protein WT83_10765 [Burkholderia territorii]
MASNQLYTQTNATTNAIVHMVRGNGGMLTIANITATGGKGANLGPDGLTSQNALAISPDKRFLYAVNAGDNSVSSFAIDAGTGNLTLVDHVVTSGNFPVSVAISSMGVLYVLQQGSQTVQAFSTANGQIGSTALGTWAIPNAGAKPTQLTLSPNGTFLVVSAGATSNELLSYPINSNGTLGSPVGNMAGVASPFAGVFVNNNLFLSSAVSAHAVQALSFQFGALTAIGSPVVGDPNGAPCWLVVTPDGKFAYAGDGGSGTIAAYSVSSSGILRLLNARAANENIAVAGDSWVSADGKYLYAAYLAAGEVIGYAINSDGSLAKIGTVSAVSGNTMQGLVGL